MSETEDIKAKLDIVDLIREYIPVKAQGVNFQAVCPFHNEKTPSFVISPDKQIWHCFGCGRGGDAFSFVMEKEGFDFREALHFLAAKAGVELKNDNPEKRSKKGRLLEILELSGKYYAHILGTSAGTKAKEYLLGRGLKEETIAKWQLGYSQDTWSNLYDFLRQRPKTGQKFNEEEIMASGMIIKKEKFSQGSNYYDRFRGRIMFPIWDASNNLVAFTARISPEKEKTEKMGKYINSPQTEIYDKSKILFGLNFAKSAIREQDFAIVVEGQMDAISCSNHGIDNVVASSGTALTGEQVALIKRFTNNIALAFDMDEAGQNAADRGIREVLAQGMNVKIITLPQGKDPDDSLRTNPDDFKNAIKDAKPMLDYYFTKISSGLDLEVLDNKMKVRDQMFNMIGLLNNKSDQGYWLKKISEELDFSETDIREEFVKHMNQESAKPTSQKSYQEGSRDNKQDAKQAVLSREEMLTEIYLAIIIKYPDLVNYGLNNLEPSQLPDKKQQGFYKSLIIYYNKFNPFSYQDFHQALSNEPEYQKFLDRLILLGEKEFYDHELEDARKELMQVVLELKRGGLKKKIRILEKELIALEKSDEADDNMMASVMTELKDATDELKKLM